jgi:AcrR family transcriptional regulator
MTSKERREREKLETRERILDAARELFATRGIEATTMRAIAERIEYTPTAIYHHFKDKDELITELCHTDFRALSQAFARIGRIDDPIEGLRRIGTVYIDFALEYPHHYRFMFMMSKPAHYHENPEEDAYSVLLQTMTEAIEQGCFRPELADAQQLSQMMWAAVHGVVSLPLAKEGADWIEWRDTREMGLLMLDTLLNALRHPVAR